MLQMHGARKEAVTTPLNMIYAGFAHTFQHLYLCTWQDSGTLAPIGVAV